MGDMALYLGITAVGYFIGDRYRKKERNLPWTAKVQTAAIAVLVFAMGLRIGANREIVGQLDTIGLYAFVFTIVVMVFSVVCIFFVRKLLGINRYGLMKTDQTEDPVEKAIEENMSGASGRRGIDPMTLVILGFVAAGIAAGYFGFALRLKHFDSFNETISLVIKLGLCTLLVFVGIDIGIEGKVVAHFRKVGIRILAIPAAVIIGTLAGSAVCALFLPISLKESLAVGAGFGWYTLAPGIIMDRGFVLAGAICFMHNVMRELLGILSIPLVARYVGFVESCGLPGSSSMDVCLPIIERATSGTTAIYSFVNGVVLSFAVPVLVTLFIA